MAGMTQQQLAGHVGIKFQQIQKYETGMNRVSASRLWDIAQALSVPVAYFFEGVDGEASETAEMHEAQAVPGDLLADKEALELVRSYYAIPENQRRRLFDLARVLSDSAAA
jgi:transcriptional regulator with XRE-family HTH domain